MRVLSRARGSPGRRWPCGCSRAGAEVTVVELGRRPRPGGQAVDVRGAAREVIERMGLVPAIRRACVDERGFAMVDARAGAASRCRPRCSAARASSPSSRSCAATSPGSCSRRPGRTSSTGSGIASPSWPRTRTASTSASPAAARERYDAVVGRGRRPLRSPRARLRPGRRLRAPPRRVHRVLHRAADPGDLDAWFLLYNAPGGRVAGLRPERRRHAPRPT